MKIAVMGPQNTGKTTFIQDFLKHFPHYESPKETYRNVINKYGLKINQETTKESQKLIRDFIFKQIENSSSENIIFDRSLLCNFVYSFAKKGEQGIDNIFLEETKELMYESLKKLDYIFFIPSAVSINIVDDKLRDTDTKFIDKINAIFIETILEISTKNIVNIKLISGSREERINQVKDFLK